MDRGFVLILIAGCGFENRVNANRDGDVDGEIDAIEIDAMVDATGAEMLQPLCVQAATLRACYDFENSLQDGSQYDNDITPSGTPVFVAGHAGGTALVTSTGTFTTANTTSLDITTFTFRMWIKPNTLPGAGARMGLFDSGGRYRMFLMPGGAIRCTTTNGPDLTTAVGAVGIGLWHRVACRYNGTTMAIFVDGAMLATETQTSSVPATGGNMVVGHDNPSGQNLNGAIDDFQIFSALVAP